MSRIGLFGGTFNPIHFGHLRIAQEAAEFAKLDQVRFIPNHLPPHRAVPQVSSVHRCNMVKLAISANPLFTIDTIEIDRQNRSYTHDTVAQLVKQHPENQYIFISGADVVVETTWFKMDELLAMLDSFCVVYRPGHNLAELQHTLQEKHYLNAHKMQWIQTFGINLSSTTIRQCLANRHSVRYLVPDEVMNYISQHQLYSPQTN